MENQDQCINCEENLIGSYCHSCGQRNLRKRITVKTLIEDFTSKWLGWDNKFLRTIRGLTFHPGETARKYIEGNRVSFVGPLGYGFLTSAIMILLFNWLSIDYGEMVRASQDVMSADTSAPGAEAAQQINETMNKLITDNIRTMVFIMIPFLALTGYLLYNSGSYGKRYNMLEHSVLHFYLAGHSVWLTILLFPVFVLIGFQYSWILTVSSLIYVIYGVYDFHQKKGLRALAKAAVTYGLGMFFFVIFVAFFTVFYIAFFTDIFQQIIENARNK